MLSGLGGLILLAIGLFIGIWLRKRDPIRRNLLLSSSSSSSSDARQKTRDIAAFALMSSKLSSNDNYTQVTNMSVRSSIDPRFYANTVDPMNGPVFGPSVRPSISKTSEMAQFLPGMQIESLVPNPVYVSSPNEPIQESANEPTQNKQEKLVTNIYITHSNKESNGSVSN